MFPAARETVAALFELTLDDELDGCFTLFVNADRQQLDRILFL